MKAARHIGIIPDGGRRWASRENIPLVDAYRRSFSRVADLLSIAVKAGFEEATVYVLSRSNLARSYSELDAVYTAFSTLYDSLAQLCDISECKEVNIIGRVESLPHMPLSWIQNIDMLCGSHHGIIVNLLVAYDAWDELADVIVDRNRTNISITDLWVKTPVDAVIRSGGTALLSGFLPLQCAYAHLLATDQVFNDLTDDDFIRLTTAAKSVRHRLGK